MEKLNQLEEEEDKLMQAGFYDEKMEPVTEDSRDIKKLAKRQVPGSNFSSFAEQNLNDVLARFQNS